LLLFYKNGFDGKRKMSTIPGRGLDTPSPLVAMGTLDACDSGD
jgi:hypothetical protein